MQEPVQMDLPDAYLRMYCLAPTRYWIWASGLLSGLTTPGAVVVAIHEWAGLAIVGVTGLGGAAPVGVALGRQRWRWLLLSVARNIGSENTG